MLTTFWTSSNEIDTYGPTDFGCVDGPSCPLFRDALVQCIGEKVSGRMVRLTHVRACHAIFARKGLYFVSTWGQQAWDGEAIDPQTAQLSDRC